MWLHSIVFGGLKTVLALHRAILFVPLLWLLFCECGMHLGMYEEAVRFVTQCMVILLDMHRGSLPIG